MNEVDRSKQAADTVAGCTYKPVSLKELAAHLGLNPATVSVVLNDVPGRSIPQATRDRIKAAAKAMNYQPSLLARSLRSRRTHTIGILVPELGDGYHTQVMSGIGDQLIQEGYFYFTAHHRHQPALIEEYVRMFLGRGAQGIITIDTKLENTCPVPVVSIAGHHALEGVINVQLDHSIAAQLTVEYLLAQGHREIAVIRGQAFSSDSESRWNELQAAAKKAGLKICPELVVTLERDISSPELGYPAVKTLLETEIHFTALLAFNDITAMGAIRALQDLNVRVPEDVSVLGFDDIPAASYTLPRLTTIRQPMMELGRIATRRLLDRMQNPAAATGNVLVTPELIVRESSGPAKKRGK